MKKEYKLTDEIIQLFIEYNHYADMRSRYVESFWSQKRAEGYGKRCWEVRHKAWNKFFSLYPEALELNKKEGTSLEWKLGWDFVLETI